MTPEELTAELQRTIRELEALRKRRDELIREHPGTLREIAEAAGVTYQRVQQIRTEGTK